MEETSTKDSPHSEGSPINQVEESHSHSPSPESPLLEPGSPSPPRVNEVNIEAQPVDSRHTVSEDRHLHRETVTNGYLNAEEVMIQRHALLNSAMVSQESESVFACKFPGCTFTSSDVELYLKHEDTHVDGGTTVCDVCNTVFSTYATMRRHRLLHLGVRPFECQVCTKRFLRKDQFMEHLLRHSKQRSYRCPFCTKTFSFRPHLKAHLTSEHASVVTDKICRLCDFEASSPNGAKIHFAMCHLKQTLDAADAESRSQEHIDSSQAHATPSESTAIDLATVSQNFSLIQAAHYSPYSAPINDNSAIVPGPSDLSHHSSKVHATAVQGPRVITPRVLETNITAAAQNENNRHTCVSAVAASTTAISSATCQDRTCCKSVGPNDHPSRERLCIKPEPPELTVDDSQNSNVQPTSTMDISAVDVVETTCVTNEPSGSSETPCRRRIHKHSSGDDTGSETHNSSPNRILDSQMAPQSSRSFHTCYRFRRCENSSNPRCREHSKHTCTSHRHPSEKRPRLSESDGDRNIQNDHSDSEERKVFYNRATSTNYFNQPEASVPRVIHHATSMHSDGSYEPELHNEPNYYGHKNNTNIVIRDIESCTLTCPYCGIIFPDQTLYLLHRSMHSDSSPWKCNLCGKVLRDKYDFNSHIISKGHY